MLLQKQQPRLRKRLPSNVRLLLATGLALLLAACGGEGARAPGGVSEGEAKALDAAAAMLDERRLPSEALPPEEPPRGEAAEMTGDRATPARR